MPDLSYQLVTGRWSYVVADGIRKATDPDAHPDEVFPGGVVVFTPQIGNNPDLPTGSPSRSVALGVITGLVADGVLQDLDGRDGIELVTRVGTRPVYWTAQPALTFGNRAIAARTYTFGPSMSGGTIHLNDTVDPGDYPDLTDELMLELLAKYSKPVGGIPETDLAQDVRDRLLSPTALAGKADLVGGKLNPAQLPDLALIDYLGTVSSQSAMLLLAGQKGDWCVRTDTSTEWRIIGADPAQLSSWTQLPLSTQALTKPVADATYAPRWQANTAYVAGQAVVLPNGTTGTAKVNFTTSTSFDASNWNIASGGGGGVGDGTVTFAKLSAALAAALMLQVAAPGTAAANVTAIQGAIDAAETAGGGMVRLTPGATYLVSTPIIPKTGVVLDLMQATIKVADGANCSAIKTADYDTLIGGDSTGGPRDFGIVNGYVDGNKTNQTATDQPVVALYARRYIIDGLMIRNGKGTGLDSQWSTTSPFQTPNGFESQLTDFTVHSCDGDGLNFRGPHDSFFSNFYIIKCGASAASAPLRFPDASGRANGSNLDKFHIYGGNGYNYGLIMNTAGVRVTNFVVEGSQTAQVLVQASQVQLDGFHIYTGGIATGTAKGLQVGDSTHTGVNAGTIRGRIENCGGGAIDVTYMGWNNDVDVHHAYFASVTPTLASLGIVGTLTNRNKFLLRTTDSGSGSGGTFAPTAGGFNNQVGPQRILRTNATDTRNLWELRDESNNIVALYDFRGRRRVNAFAVPTIAAGAGAGTSPTVAISGDDTAGTITITVGTAPAPGLLATVTFSGVFGNAPHVTLTPGDAASAIGDLFATRSTSAFSVRCAGTPDAGDVYTIFYKVVGA